jgi:hypothetical protein
VKIISASCLSFLGGIILAVTGGLYWLHEQSVEEGQQPYEVVFNSRSQTVLTSSDIDRCYLIENGKPYVEPAPGTPEIFMGYSDERVQKCAQLLDKVALDASKRIQEPATEPATVDSSVKQRRGPSIPPKGGRK